MLLHVYTMVECVPKCSHLSPPTLADDSLHLNEMDKIALKRLLGMIIFNFVNFGNLIYIKLYSLLILNKIQNIKRQCKSIEKDETSCTSKTLLSC